MLIDGVDDLVYLFIVLLYGLFGLLEGRWGFQLDRLLKEGEEGFPNGFHEVVCLGFVLASHGRIVAFDCGCPQEIHLYFDNKLYKTRPVIMITDIRLAYL